MIIIHDTLIGSNMGKDFYYNSTPKKMSKFQNEKIMSCVVERRASFSKYKNILRLREGLSFLKIF